jgi:hypothetical protein
MAVLEQFFDEALNRSCLGAPIHLEEPRAGALDLADLEVGR